jgi:CheY-like chemotaxis protein
MRDSFSICIIDDDMIYQFITKRIFETKDYIKKVLAFADGEQAIQFFADNLHNVTALPDIIFLDINMPIMDGWQFMSAYATLKAQINKKITIYIVSSSVDVVDLEKVKEFEDIIGYLTKPVTPERFIEAIATLE